MKAILQVADKYYVLANSVLANRDTRVLKHGETFAIFDSYGDIQPVTHPESGVFFQGTRHLSKYELNVFGDQRPLLLNSTLRDDNGVLKVDMTNPDVTLPGIGFMPKGTLHIHREKFVLESACLEQIVISNFSPHDIDMDLSFRFECDFADIFEVRGTSRKRRGHLETKQYKEDGVSVGYVGLDGVRRETHLMMSNSSFTVEDDVIQLHERIPSRGIKVLHFNITDQSQRGGGAALFQQGLGFIQKEHSAGRKSFSGIRSSNEQFDNWIRRSTDDLIMLTTATDEGVSYPYAGIPWFCAPFGRDGIITAMECLWANTQLAKGVLQYLARTQAQESSHDLESSKGKIIHEVRKGEMAALKEIPFGMYYGSVDSTPLFVALAGMYFQRTNDLELIQSLWPSIERSLHWLDHEGDLDGDGFFEYERENPNGLIHQGWKDSNDSVFHSDDRDALGPIALCEVQGYGYLAMVQGANLAEVMNYRDLAFHLRQRAVLLRERFDEAFWLDELGTFALALDGKKEPCRVVSSNAGQCLFTGIVKPERVPRLVQTLMRPESFSGWGIRTVAVGSPRYNPMSYHNGSVWPHDVAMIAWGMAKYGYKDDVERLFNGLFRAATYMDLMRMPEVFCGFVRREGEPPTLYPHACSPQAWAAASVYSLLQSMLGLEIDGPNGRISFSYPRLPDSIETLRLLGVRVGDETVDFTIQNYHNDVSVQIARRNEHLKVVIEK